ncbi:MAG TPA: SDR family oxidoreductase [Rhodanobacteraceae bacterium]|nr:SDR family oxidoreductase [Rhodanobacteraceae bacterium]
MDINLSGKHALVCGASQGIGRATALELASLGARVTALARRGEVLEGLVASLPGPAAGQHDYLAIDASDTDALATAARALVARDPVDILVNNSGGPPPGPIHGAQTEDFLAALRQHLLANHVLAEAVIPRMREARWGRIVNVISTSVKEPIPGIGVSNTTRGAVASWAKTLSRELAPFGITVNNVLPGSTQTPRIEQLLQARAARGDGDLDAARAAMTADIPMGRFAEPAETAAVIAFLASPAAGYVSGVSLPVDGGRMRSL